MGRFKHIIQIGLIAAALLVSFRGCKHHQDIVTEQAMSPVLKDKDLEKITVDIRAGKVEQTTRLAPDAVGTTNPGTTTTRHLDGTRKLAITVEKDGSLVLYAQRSGFILEPGIGWVYEERGRLSVDAQLWYWRRYGIMIGGSYSPNAPLRCFVAGSYNLYHNTSLIIGLDNHKDPVVGLRVGF